MTIPGQSPLTDVSSVMEVPIMDDKKWSKIPNIPADAFFVDLEDSAPLALKGEARERAVELIKDPSHLGGRIPIPRVNNLETPWGYDDLVAMARAGAEVVTYPKVGSAGELETVREIFRKYDADPKLCAVIESARGICNVKEIVGVEGLCGIFFGPSDLALNSGFELFDESGMTAPILDAARSSVIFAAAAYGVATYDALFVRDMRNLEQVAASVRNSRRIGFSGVITFYPSHVPVINDIYGVDQAQLERARKIVELYEEAMNEGRTAVLLDGEALIIQDYKRARAVLGRPL